jgi:hypothetical protein
LKLSGLRQEESGLIGEGRTNTLRPEICQDGPRRPSRCTNSRART